MQIYNLYNFISPFCLNLVFFFTAQFSLQNFGKSCLDKSRRQTGNFPTTTNQFIRQSPAPMDHCKKTKNALQFSPRNQRESQGVSSNFSLAANFALRRRFSESPAAIKKTLSSFKETSHGACCHLKRNKADFLRYFNWEVVSVRNWFQPSFVAQINIRISISCLDGRSIRGVTSGQLFQNGEAKKG